MGTLLLWLLVLGFVGAFAFQVATRIRLIAGAPSTFSTDDVAVRVWRFVTDVVGQRRTIKDRQNFQADIMPVPAGSLPRFEMKARRIVRE